MKKEDFTDEVWGEILSVVEGAHYLGVLTMVDLFGVKDVS